jgi:hypothetical protein
MKALVASLKIMQDRKWALLSSLGVIVVLVALGLTIHRCFDAIMSYASYGSQRSAIRLLTRVGLYEDSILPLLFSVGGWALSRRNKTALRIARCVSIVTIAAIVSTDLTILFVVDYWVRR